MSSAIFFVCITKKLRLLQGPTPWGWDLVNIVEKSETKEELLKELDRLLKKVPQ